MMELKFTVSQTAAAMGMEPARMWALLGQWGVQPREDSLTLEQIQQLRQLLSEHQDEHQLRAQNSLERVVQRYTLLADTCSLLHQQFPLLAERLTPLLRQSCRTLIVPSGVLAELRSLPLKKPELTERVRTALPCLAKLQNQGLLRIYGEREGSFGDQQLLSSATRLMTSSPLLVITQDRDLSCDLLRLNQLDSMREKQPVAVSRINRYGYLSRFQPLEQRPADTRAEGAAAFAGADGDLRRREGAPLGGLSWTERRADPAPAEQPLPRHRELDRQPAPKDAGEDAPAGSWRLLWRASPAASGRSLRPSGLPLPRKSPARSRLTGRSGQRPERTPLRRIPPRCTSGSAAWSAGSPSTSPWGRPCTSTSIT